MACRVCGWLRAKGETAVSAGGGQARVSVSHRVGSDEYVSDPAKPVPYRLRPDLPVGYAGIYTWPRWLVDDQREFSGRTDVLTYTSDVLTEPLTNQRRAGCESGGCDDGQRRGLGGEAD